jgi:hypothetical protein
MRSRSNQLRAAGGADGLMLVRTSTPVVRASSGGSHPRHGARHESRLGDDGGLRADARRRTRAATSTSRTARQGRRAHCRAHAHQPVDARALRREHRGDERKIFHGAARSCTTTARTSTPSAGFQAGRHGSDIVHINLHKSLSPTHGGGGPGGGPVAVRTSWSCSCLRRGRAAGRRRLRPDFDPPRRGRAVHWPGAGSAVRLHPDGGRGYARCPSRPCSTRTTFSRA